ncbi:hypothetical protein GCM10009678_22430 [Actinomadura kijaniata]|uniref:Secreted protein n=1 Tax=Actinomadura namibiensis TaxID=182080 RepID=A0A7W3LNA3_ACTNM|nr:hypothetical protein [Actinomadura namibiensis]MBA8951165.1 hypothetical protein [Actinomadura namibiensis]
MRRTLTLSAAGLFAAASLATAAPAQAAAPVPAQAPVPAAADGWTKWKTGKIKKPVRGAAVKWKYRTRWEMGEKQLQIRYELTDTASDKRHPVAIVTWKTWEGVENSFNISGAHKKTKVYWWKGTPRSIKVRACVKGTVWGSTCDKKYTPVYDRKWK